MPAALPKPRSARTVLLRMAADQDRAERIRKLKRERPDLKWRVIADHVGVTERAAASWAQSGGIAYDNAKKLAEIFEVDVDYIMRGEPTAPDLLEVAARRDQVDGGFEEFRQHVADLEGQLERVEGKLDLILHALGLTQPVEDDAPARVVEAIRDAAARAGALPEPEARSSRQRRATR